MHTSHTDIQKHLDILYLFRLEESFWPVAKTHLEKMDASFMTAHQILYCFRVPSPKIWGAACHSVPGFL